MRLNLPIGQAWMEAKYAPTGRATCKRCENKIQKGELRLTNIEDEDHFRSEMHYHADCFQLKPYFQEAKYTDVFYVDELKPDDQESVEKQFQKLIKKQSENQKTTKRKKKKTNVDSDSDFKEVKIPKKKSTKKIKELQPKVEYEIDSTDSDYLCIYNDKQKSEFNRLQKILSYYNEEQLRQQLKKNYQKHTGNKSQLIRRVADCRVLGCLGKCTNCSQGSLKLNKETKQFKCTGYMDGNVFKICDKIWDNSQFMRAAWKY